MNIKTTYNFDAMRYAWIYFILLYTVAGCSLNLDLDEQDTITQQDIDAVSQIIGESLSDENSGIIGSFYDAITDISANGFVRTTQFQAKSSGHDDNTGRGDERDISYRYIAETGQHELSFQRIVSLTDYSKQVSDTLRYIFRDQSGQLISDLELADGNSSTIQFTAFRTGDIQSQNRTSFFSRKDTFFIDGVEATSGDLFVDGVHHGSGLFQGVTVQDSIPFERAYELEVNFLNIIIKKSVLNENISLEQAVSGALSYSLVIEDPNNANVSRTISGSLDFVGDGTATIRFRNAPDLFQVNLDNGTVNNQRSEFEGRIISVNLQQSSFTLANGIRINVDSNTNISPDSDLFTLQAVKDAIDSGQFARAEGNGNVNGDLFLASEVEYELDDDNDDENNDIQFEQSVQSVDTVRRTFTLRDGRVIGLDQSSIIDDDGDFISLAEVAQALLDEVLIIADGDARYIDSDTLNYIATEVEFESGEAGDEGSEDSDIINFDGKVLSVNVSESTFTLDNGAVIQVNSETEVSGDFINLQEVQNELSTGQSVEADGKAVENTESRGINLIALEVEFESGG